MGSSLAASKLIQISHIIVVQEQAPVQISKSQPNPSSKKGSKFMDYSSLPVWSNKQTKNPTLKKFYK
jgi:hypothetical protein